MELLPVEDQGLTIVMELQVQVLGLVMELQAGAVQVAGVDKLVMAMEPQR